MNASLIPPTKRGPTLRTLCLCLLLVGLLPSLRAGQFGLFTYERVEDTIEITGYPQDAVGAVEIPAVIEGLPVTRLGPKTFSGCTNLTHITIPESITQIGSIPGPVIRGGLHGWGTFYGCIELTSVTLPTRITTLGAGAFEGCTSLTEVTIPETVTTLGDRAFAHCTGLTEVKILDGVTDIGRFMFWGCTGLTRVTIPGTVNALGNGAFADCTGLTEVTILEGVTGIGNGADDFAGLPGGWDASAPFVWGVFEGCTSLTDVLVPASVSYLGPRSFARCNRLAGVAISAGVIGISDEAFLGCTALTRVLIPASVGAVGRRSFSDCTGLKAIVVDPRSPFYVSLDGVLFSKDRFALMRYPGGRAGGYTIPTGVSTIESEAFSGCTGLTRVAIPGSVADIGFYPFAGCTGLKAIEVEAQNPAYASVDGVLFTKNGSLLVQYPGGKGGSYTLPNGVTRIGNGAFAYCPGLTRVTIPDSLTTLGRIEYSWLRPRKSSFGLFENCPALTGLYFQGRGPTVESWEPSYAAGFAAYHLAGTESWGPTLLSAPTALWTQPLLLSDAPGSGVSADGLGFTISWAPNARVVVEASPQLDPPAWTPVSTNLLTGGSSRFTDPQWAAHPNRFYRLRTP
jgi:hypothetical protein